MFKTTNNKYENDKYANAKSNIGEYLNNIGIALSDLIEINGISVVRSNFWGQKSNDMHAIFSLGDYETNKGKIIHVQAYTMLSIDSKNPLICAKLRETPRMFNDKVVRADATKILKDLLAQSMYSNDANVPARMIAARYNIINSEEKL